MKIVIKPPIAAGSDRAECRLINDSGDEVITISAHIDVYVAVDVGGEEIPLSIGKLVANTRDAARWQELMRQHTSEDKSSLTIARWNPGGTPGRYAGAGGDPVQLIDEAIERRKR